MKGHLNIVCIYNDFWAALARNLSKLQFLLVVVSFFVAPIGVGVITHELCITIPAEQFSSLISTYAIFSALLFGAQISAFSIFSSMTDYQKSRIEQDEPDQVLKASVEADATQRISDLKMAFKDINANISYLILTSVVLLSILIFSAIAEAANALVSAIVISLTVHLVLVLTMVIKQCHLIFGAAYSD
ncbi:hypothetical protein OU789_16750 [Halocynthiibacter sp. C4]|uniref:hypothetical protein n=1 Tax=Halocynthiibacter sp. C4 TaxID=2992758 RepID=UPI00237B61CC|nr:hypothetical protein [Halocynthiibacter sp. C4]MDE0591590.1 hypothetical protein [Halocynthiibacter sp. C4]